MTWVLLSACGLLFVGLGLALLRLAEVEREFRAEEKADHAKCIAHIASVTSNAFVAARLHDIADEWDSIEGQAELRRIVNTRYRIDGPSAMSLRLHEMADVLAGEPVVDDASA